MTLNDVQQYLDAYALKIQAQRVARRWHVTLTSVQLRIGVSEWSADGDSLDVAVIAAFEAHQAWVRRKGI